MLTLDAQLGAHHAAETLPKLFQIPPSDLVMHGPQDAPDAAAEGAAAEGAAAASAAAEGAAEG